MTPSTTTTGLIWDEAAGAEAVGLARAFESAWKASAPGRRPAPDEFLEIGGKTRPGELLAILRVDLTHRRKAGEDASPELYRDRYPCLHPDALVALVYEDYCLREEAGEPLDPRDYEARFPEVAARLHELLVIHDLVAEPGSTSLDHDADLVAFPEVGQTIAGFRLVEELGRGSFARVFLAQERQLADRPVALKVSRTGSREPQTLARLQHTHIVPVHSYRTDPATGLHLLCMPYFGRVTLSRLLADPALLEPKSGAALVAALDRIGGEGPVDRARATALGALASRSYPRAVAWWGARMAEGLQHAHDRGVLHRDVKPSNVLIAGDGLPMLLDFNLSRERDIEATAPSKLGGTLAYMAPEHLEALAEGHDGGIDHRADIYSLGMVLLECLGSKPMEGASEATTLLESLTWLLDHRRKDVTELAIPSGPIPPALEAVIRRCLAPSRNDRYASAGDLAIDLRGVADDAPLTFAREPLSPRVARWARRNRARLAVVAPLLVAAVALLVVLVRAQAESIRVEAGARGLIQDGERSSKLGEYQAAAAQFATASAMLDGRASLASLRDEANRNREGAEAAKVARDLAETFFERAEPLRFALLGFVGDRTEASRSLIEAFRPLGVLEGGDWLARPALARLDPLRKTRLRREVDDLLFFWVVAAAMDAPDRRQAAPVAISYCELALRSTDSVRPWRALLESWRGDPPGRPDLPPDPALENSPSACFLWYWLAKLANDKTAAVAWLERAARLEPSSYFHQFALAFQHAEAGRFEQALAPIDAAIALRPDSPCARKVRARVMAGLGLWAEALGDLRGALEVCSNPLDRARVRFDRGSIRQRLGDFRGARADIEAVLRVDPSGRLGRDATRNLARLEADSGANAAALAHYDALLASDPKDDLARRGRLRLRLRTARPDLAEDDLDILLDTAPSRTRAEFLAERALARLARGRPNDAEADAAEAAGFDPSPSNTRLLDRARLASGKGLVTRPDRPESFDGWPDAGRPLNLDLQALAGRLDPQDHRTRAVLLSAARDHRQALEEADRLVAKPPRSVDTRLTRARVRHRGGRRDEAMADVTQALRESPEHPGLMELRGILRVESGDLEGGLIDLRVARDRGAASAVGPTMARALLALGRPDQAAEVWSRRIEQDPLDPRNYLELASTQRQRGEWDRALEALEAAASVVDDGSPILGPILLGYAACLPARPDRAPRIFGLGRRLAAGWWRR